MFDRLIAWFFEWCFDDHSHEPEGNHFQQLNWTSRPFQGDVQISLYHYFLPAMPPGLNHRLVALVNNALVDKSAYHYYWKFGTLTRLSDILVFVSCEQDEFLEISARITAEDENDTACVEALWLELVYVMNMIQQFMLTSWTGVRTTVRQEWNVANILMHFTVLSRYVESLFAFTRKLHP